MVTALGIWKSQAMSAVQGTTTAFVLGHGGGASLPSATGDDGRTVTDVAMAFGRPPVAPISQ